MAEKASCTVAESRVATETERLSCEPQPGRDPGPYCGAPLVTERRNSRSKENTEKAARVLDDIIVLLGRHNELARANWLSIRQAVLLADSSDASDIRRTFEDIRSVIGGMGGLVDIRLLTEGQQDAAANTELYRLTARLFELTR